MALGNRTPRVGLALGNLSSKTGQHLGWIPYGIQLEWGGEGPGHTHTHTVSSTLDLLLPPPAGTLPNITRNAIVNCGEMVTYDLIKEALLEYQLMTGKGT